LILHHFSGIVVWCASLPPAPSERGGEIQRGRNKEREKYKGKNLVLWHTERNYRVINSFVFLKICEEPFIFYL
jgi:hypothetical protein